MEIDRVSNQFPMDNSMQNKLNILMITHHRRHKIFPRSYAIAHAMVQRGHKVTLITISDRSKWGILDADWDGVRVVETPDLLWGQLRSGWDLWNLINRIIYLCQDKGPYDFVHCFETRPATIYPALLYCRQHKLPLLTDWNDWWGRGGLVDEVRPVWYRFLFGGVETYYEEAFRKRGVGTTVISSALARRAAGLGVQPERILHLPGGAFPDFFQQQQKSNFRKRIGLDLSIPVIGFSSLDSHLDLDIILRALSIVAERYPTVKLMITGRPAKSIFDLAKAHGVEDNLYLTGFLPYEELPHYLGCADLFVLPLADKVYNTGRWPNKICDYMSLGRPTISNPVGDIKTLFEEHEIGLLVRWDPVDFSEKIIYLIENPDVAEKLGDNARRVAVTEYDWNLLVQRLEDFYYVLLNESDNPKASGLSQLII
jgi:glycosyltransferase involved in cell wall biosynthesis